MVEEEHAQSEAMRGAAPTPEDHWRPYAANFRADPRRADDPMVQHLLRFLGPDDTLMDVGAGGGRLALPLALHCRDVVAVEPSASMASLLMQQAQDSGIHNVSLVRSLWEDAEVEPADLVLCSHVVYAVREIDAFIRKLDYHARHRVVVIVYNAPPQSQIYPLWQRVHWQERLALPSLPQLLE
ncbi:MAG: class I SAM-dependent methyltransferase, partial [Dehalococcoidia bacterium]